MKTSVNIFLSLLFLISFFACKPTEKGYKTAYDAALGKRQSVASSINIENQTSPILQVDGPQLKEIDGVPVYLLSERIKKAGESMSLPGNYNVAVGSYKMITNSNAQANDLKEEGYEAFPAVDTEGKYYTIAFSSDNLSEAVQFYKKYQNLKNRVYVGLPEAPVILYSPK